MEEPKSLKQHQNSTICLIVGIVSILACRIPIGGLIAGIIAIYLRNSTIKEIGDSAKEYTTQTFQFLNIGRICGYIAIILSVCMFIILQMNS